MTIDWNKNRVGIGTEDPDTLLLQMGDLTVC